MTTLVVSAALFDDEDRILCVRQTYNGSMWTLPGGGLEAGESPLDALAREINEETGYVAEIGDLIGIYSAPWKDSLGLLFQARSIERDPWEPDSEISQIGFYARDHLPSPMTTRMLIRIQDAYDGQRGIVRIFSLSER